MRKGSPSMIALLGLLAVAGYQNRDKLSRLVKNAPDRGEDNGNGALSGATEPREDMLDTLRQKVGETGGNVLAGLSDLLARFSNPVQSAKASTWVNQGPNGDLAAGDLEEVLDESTMTDLMQQTGLGRSELLERLSAILPEAVDKLTPKGRLPTADEALGQY